MNDYKNILEIKNEKIGNYSAEIAKWNYWDHEHLDVVHQGYTDSDILYEKDNIPMHCTLIYTVYILILTNNIVILHYRQMQVVIFFKLSNAYLASRILYVTVMLSCKIAWTAI